RERLCLWMRPVNGWGGSKARDNTVTGLCCARVGQEAGAHMAVEIGAAYLSVIPSTKGFAGALYKQIGKEVPKVGNQAGQTMGARMAAAAGKALKAGAVVGVAAVGAAVGTALVGGFKNAVSRQNSQKVLTGLYGSAKDATKVKIGRAHV